MIMSTHILKLQVDNVYYIIMYPCMHVGKLYLIYAPLQHLFASSPVWAADFLPSLATAVTNTV
jgi:hypothetical protein